jgi:amino acid transporter
MSEGRRGGSAEAPRRAPAPSPFFELPSKTVFFGASFGAFAAGALGGVYFMARKEHFRLSLREHRTPFAVASRALLLGTALCFGSFAAGTAVIVGAMGITSFAQFSDALTHRLGKVEALKTKDGAVLADVEKIKKLNEEEEMAFWNRFFWAPPPEQESTSSPPPPK